MKAGGFQFTSQPRHYYVGLLSGSEFVACKLARTLPKINDHGHLNFIMQAALYSRSAIMHCRCPELCSERKSDEVLLHLMPRD